MKKYMRHASEVKGKTTAFTEIIIHAPTEVVRENFLNFTKWGEWNTVFTKIEVKKGDIDKLETQPTLNLEIDFGRKNDPSTSPISPRVYENSPEIFHWGFNYGILKAEHLFIFESIENNSRTRFINYEKAGGLLKSLVMTQIFRENMVANYNTMNVAFKKLCEAQQSN